MPVPGLVFALSTEAVAVLGKRTVRSAGFGLPYPFGNNEFLWTISGVGSQRAVYGAESLVKSGVDLLVSIGVSGGLSPDCVPGDLVVGTSSKQSERTIWKDDGFALRMAEALRRHGHSCLTGPLLTCEQPLLTPQKKQQWFKKTEALAVDMESAGVARVARAARVPFLPLRVVCDGPDRTVPPALLDAVDVYGRQRPDRLLQAILRNPLLIGGLIRVGLDFAKAASTMKRSWAECRNVLQQKKVTLPGQVPAPVS